MADKDWLRDYIKSYNKVTVDSVCAFIGHDLRKIAQMVHELEDEGYITVSEDRRSLFWVETG